jgi:alpha-glucosidase
VKSALLDQGIVATWNDNNEYEIWDRRARFAGFGEPRAAAEMRPVQPLLMARASRRAQVEAFPQRRPYVVTRSGMAGLQRYAQTWSGDNRTEWKTLRYNARMAIGLALCGVSNSGPRCRRLRGFRTVSRVAGAVGAGRRADASLQHSQLER